MNGIKGWQVNPGHFQKENLLLHYESLHFSNPQYIIAPAAFTTLRQLSLNRCAYSKTSLLEKSNFLLNKLSSTIVYTKYLEKQCVSRKAEVSQFAVCWNAKACICFKQFIFDTVLSDSALGWAELHQTVSADLSSGHLCCQSPIIPHPKGILLDSNLSTGEVTETH